jgi:hypothetical protein
MSVGGIYEKSTIVRIGLHALHPKSYTINNIKLLIRNPSFRTLEDNTNPINSAMEWLYQAYTITKPGVSGFYHLHYGWGKAYPETTGYIIETFYDYIDFIDKNGINQIERAKYLAAPLDMANWLMSIQDTSGGFFGGQYNPEIQGELNVFDTGQIIFGLLKTYRMTNEEKYLLSAIKAGNWLVENQENDGSWVKFTYEKGSRAYHARVSWALCELFSVTNNEKFLTCAKNNLNWVLSNVNENYWVNKTEFFDANLSLTHTLAYTIRGLLESGILLNNDSYIHNAILIAEKLMQIYEIKKEKLIPGFFDRNWNKRGNFSCLTGCVQISIIWLKIYLYTNDIRFLNSAIKLNSSVKCIQDNTNKNPFYRGGIPGSFPIYGSYMAFSYPNWATKFFVDALLLEEISKKKWAAGSRVS